MLDLVKLARLVETPTTRTAFVTALATRVATSTFVYGDQPVVEESQGAGLWSTRHLPAGEGWVDWPPAVYAGRTGAEDDAPVPKFESRLRPPEVKPLVSSSDGYWFGGGFKSNGA